MAQLPVVMPKSKGRARPVVGQDGVAGGGEVTESRGATTGVATCRGVASDCVVDFVGDEWRL